MVKKSRSSVLGLHTLKNKVSRNAFDLSHRHMFTSQIGELLPVFYQWCNPNETFKLSYDGMTRTAPLNTAAFTRLRENIQFFFVPFQCLWRYFEQTVNNMTKGQAGQSISMIANSQIAPQSLSTSLPYVNYKDLRDVIRYVYTYSVEVLSAYYSTLDSASEATATGFYDYVRDSLVVTDDSRNELFNAVFFNGQYRYVAIAKLLNSLGYGNFSSVITHDLFAVSTVYLEQEQIRDFQKEAFLNSKYSLKFDGVFKNSPNLSVLPLVAYHKIVNDYYRYRQWQSYESWTSNLDFMTPNSSMSYLSTGPLASPNGWKDNQNTIFDLEFSNLPIDYFTGVLPRAQYGEESAVAINSDGDASSIFGFSDLKFVNRTVAGDVSYGGTTDPQLAVKLPNGSSPLTMGTFKTTDISSSGTLKISALRSAVALQKYKEIQNANDWSFEEQVLAHFGIKPSCDEHKSRFIGGADSTIGISQQINNNFADGAMPEIKAIGEGGLHCTSNFKSDTYGIIIGIYRCTPQLDYSHVGIDRNLYKTDASDFPLPELDSVGMQTQYRSEVSAPDICASSAPIDMSATYGYAPRFCELKTSFDRYDGGFNDAYSDWVTGFDARTLSHWFDPALHSRPGYWLDVTSLFICRPSLLYPIFVNQWSGTANDDKLLVASVNGCTAVRPYSVHGLPYSN